MQQRDPYSILGVVKTASASEIKQAYKCLARENHPDVNPGDEGAEERFKEISWAKEILLDKKRRKLFDEFGNAGLAPGFDPEQARAYQQWARRAERSAGSGAAGEQEDLDELLSQMFGGDRRGRGAGPDPFVRFDRRKPTQGADLHADVRVDLLDIAGAGEVDLVSTGRPTLKVKIPPGARDGTRIRLAGQGGPAPPGGRPGDLYVRLRVRPHAFFRPDGDDLRIELPVTLPELVLGAEIEVPTPDGSVRMKVPPGSRNGRTLRLRGKGAARRAGGCGDLYVELSAVLPDSNADRLAVIARELEPLYEQDVRAALRGGRKK